MDKDQRLRKFKLEHPDYTPDSPLSRIRREVEERRANRMKRNEKIKELREKYKFRLWEIADMYNITPEYVRQILKKME